MCKIATAATASTLVIVLLVYILYTGDDDRDELTLTAKTTAESRSEENKPQLKIQAFNTESQIEEALIAGRTGHQHDNDNTVIDAQTVENTQKSGFLPRINKVIALNTLYKITSHYLKVNAMKTMQLQFRGTRIIGSFVFTMLCFLTSPVQAAADLVYDSLSSWNGKKVYLSPARHSDAGSRGECQGAGGMGSLDENTAAYRFAYYAASGNYVGSTISTSPYRNLRLRGYKVRIGRGTVSSAIANSNAWGATVHIPIHSNARSENCSNTSTGSHGTHVIYKSYGSSGGEGLSGRIKDTLGPSSPGTNDLICHNSSACTAFNCLGELCNTVAKAAYLEREFHTWNRGAKWMETDQYNTWRLGWAVDLFLGYPRN